jgi:esterase/lipase
MNKFTHLLAKHGILVAFNVAKKVNPADIETLKSKLEKTCDSPEEMNKKLEQMIVLQMKNTINNEKIPGLIINKNSNEPFDHIPEKLKQKLVTISMMFNNILSQEKFNTELILIIIQLVMMNNKINNQDIIDFNKKYKFRSDDDSNYLDEEDDDETDDDKL